MFDLKRETRKKNIFFGMSVFFAVLFVAALISVVVCDIEPIKCVVPAFLAFCACSMLYRNSKKAIKENCEK